MGLLGILRSKKKNKDKDKSKARKISRGEVNLDAHDESSNDTTNESIMSHIEIIMALSDERDSCVNEINLREFDLNVNHEKNSCTKKELSIPNIEETNSTTREIHDIRHEINSSTTPKSNISKTDKIPPEIIVSDINDINRRQLQLNTNNERASFTKSDPTIPKNINFLSKKRLSSIKNKKHRCHDTNTCATPKSISKTNNSLSEEKQSVINKVICRQLELNTCNETSSTAKQELIITKTEKTRNNPSEITNRSGASNTTGLNNKEILDSVDSWNEFSRAVTPNSSGELCVDFSPPERTQRHAATSTPLFYCKKENEIQTSDESEGSDMSGEFSDTSGESSDTSVESSIDDESIESFLSADNDSSYATSTTNSTNKNDNPFEAISNMIVGDQPIKYLAAINSSAASNNRNEVDEEFEEEDSDSDASYSWIVGFCACKPMVHV